MSYAETNEFDPIVTYIFLSFVILYLVYCCCECCIFISKRKKNFNVFDLHNEFMEEIDSQSLGDEYLNNDFNIEQNSLNQRNFNRLFVI